MRSTAVKAVVKIDIFLILKLLWNKEMVNQICNSLKFIPAWCALCWLLPELCLFWCWIFTLWSEISGGEAPCVCFSTSRNGGTGNSGLERQEQCGQEGIKNPQMENQSWTWLWAHILCVNMELPLVMLKNIGQMICSMGLLCCSIFHGLWYLLFSHSRGFGSQSCCSPPSPASSVELLHPDRWNLLKSPSQIHRQDVTLLVS